MGLLVHDIGPMTLDVCFASVLIASRRTKSMLVIVYLGACAWCFIASCSDLKASTQKSNCNLQVPVIQVLLGNTGIVSSQQMFAQWRYVVVGATIAAAVLTPSTDPFTQTLLAVPLIGLYLGGAACVRLIESQKSAPSQTPS